MLDLTFLLFLTANSFNLEKDNFLFIRKINKINKIIFCINNPIKEKIIFQDSIFKLNVTNNKIRQVKLRMILV